MSTTTVVVEVLFPIDTNINSASSQQWPSSIKYFEYTTCIGYRLIQIAMLGDRYLYCSCVPRTTYDTSTSRHFEKKMSKHVSREFDKFRVDTRLCKLRDTPNFVAIMEESN